MKTSATSQHLPRVRFRPRGASLNLEASNSGDLIRQVQRGLSYRALLALEDHSGISVSDLASVLGIPERTLARRKASGKLSWEESERLLRVAEVFEKAVELFEGDIPAAVGWLTAPKRALSDTTPLDYSRTELGAREVQSLMGRLEHGVFA